MPRWSKPRGAGGGNSRYGNSTTPVPPDSVCHPLDGRKEVLAEQPMLFTVQYILSTLLRIPSTWENSHSFPQPRLLSLSLSLSASSVRLHRRFLPRPSRFLSTLPSVFLPPPLLEIIFVYGFKSSLGTFK